MKRIKIVIAWFVVSLGCNQGNHVTKEFVNNRILNFIYKNDSLNGELQMRSFTNLLRDSRDFDSEFHFLTGCIKYYYDHDSDSAINLFTKGNL